MQKIREKDWPENVTTPLAIWDHLPICGCGCTEEALDLLWWMLEYCVTKYSGLGRESVEYDSVAGQYRQFREYLEGRHVGMAYALWYALSTLDLTEHGGSVPGWLTGKGAAAVRYLRVFGSDTDNWPEGLHCCQAEGDYYEVTDEQAERLERWRRCG